MRILTFIFLFLGQPAFAMTGAICAPIVANMAGPTEDSLLEILLGRFTAQGAMLTSTPYESAMHSGEITYDKFHWVRDSGIVMNTILRASRNVTNPGLSHQIWSQTNAFFKFSRSLQLTHNRSGSPDNGGLGETRFFLNGGVDRSDWAFPQNDGPAIRAMAASRFVGELLRKDQWEMVRRNLFDGALPTHTVAKADVEYVAHHWMHPCFDLWEERMGHHFFTRMVQRGALLEGIKMASLVGDKGAARAYSLQIEHLEKALDAHWSESEGHIVATVEGDGSVSWPILDTSAVIAVNLSSVPNRVFSVSSDKVMATVARIEEFFEQKYAINQITIDHAGKMMAPAIGRNRQDIYDGANPRGESGNPWVITTAALAEYYFRLANELDHAGKFEITARALPFFQRLFPGRSFQAGSLITSALFEEAIARIREKGHAFLRRIQFHFPPDKFFLTEQFHRDSGEAWGAPNLTWSYSSYLSALLEARAVSRRTND